MVEVVARVLCMSMMQSDLMSELQLQVQVPTMNATSKLSMVLHQLATRMTHIAGFQEMRSYDMGINIVDGFVV